MNMQTKKYNNPEIDKFVIPRQQKIRPNAVQGHGTNDWPNVTQWTDANGVKWYCPIYKTWAHMLQRCFNVALKTRFPSYNDVTVCNEWRLFSNFRSWFLEQNPTADLELDKDIILNP